ncbi:MAG: cysteine desulfurase [Thermoflexales bacterium]|nr:cysteine desulfurase [Thermoflexales bacterium]
MFDASKVRQDFPLLTRGDTVFLDSAASSQKPEAVLRAMDDVYRRGYANVHRGVYAWSEAATAAYDAARAEVADFLGAPSPEEIVFTRNATESLNLLAYSYGRTFLKAGDEIILSELEHHANFVPWLVLARERGVVLRFWPVGVDGTLSLAALDALITPRTRLITFAQVSNVLGTITDPRPVVARARAVGARVIVDGAQSAPHMPVNVADLGVDFFVCSGHKMLGPTGIGVLYGRRELLEAMPPFLTGGDMISRVSFEGATWNEVPLKFEAGTPAFVEAIGLGAAVRYLSALGMANVRAHEIEITDYALERLSEVPGLRILGPDTADRHGGAIAFTLPRVHPHDLASLLDQRGIAVRAGHHCAQPLHERLGITASTRASFYVYSMPQDVDALIEGIESARKTLRA